MTTTQPLDPSGAARLAEEVLAEVGRAVVGKPGPLRLLLAAVLAGGHVLLEDLPGLGKTLAARSVAAALGLDFARAQFTPDLLPADLTGSYLFHQGSGRMDFRPGPVFTQVLLADEINRTPPKTQSALLEAMQERQVTVEGATHPLPAPFVVLATANPVEHEGTYPLPEAQLDRFLVRVSFGYPSASDEVEVLRRRVERRREEVEVEAVTDAAGVLALQAAVEAVALEESVARYCVDLAEATRRHRDTAVGASPRGSLGLALVGRAHALLDGRDFTLPEDVKAVATSVLAHRLVLRPELWLSGTTGEHVVEEVLGTVPTPASAGPR